MTYKARLAGFEEIANGPEMRALLEAKVAEAKTIAVGLSQDFEDTGEYAASFETSVDVEAVIKGNPRLVGRLTNTAPYAMAVEYGYEGRSAQEGKSAHHVLKRTLDAMGD